MMTDPLSTPEDIVAGAIEWNTPDLDDELAEWDTPQKPPWRIEDQHSADWVFAKMRAEHRAFDDDTEHIAIAIDALNAEKARLQAHVDRRATRRDRKVYYLEGRLTEWLSRRWREDGVKSVRCAGGIVKSTKARDKVEIVDEDAAASPGFAQGWATTVVQFNKPELMRHIKATGELPPGVTLNVADDDDRAFTVTLDEDE